MADLSKSTQCNKPITTEKRLSECEHNVKHILLSIAHMETRFRKFEDFLIENLEDIKCVKADKEDVVERFNAKADRVDVEKKVEYHCFEHATTDLSIGLRIALEKIERMFLQLIEVRDKIEGFELLRQGLMADKGDKRVGMNSKRIAKEVRLKSNKNDVDRPIPIKASRYCGGRHTKTNALERTFKKYNFYAAHPELKVDVAACLQAHAFATGTDGKLYRVQKTECDCQSATDNDPPKDK